MVNFTGPQRKVVTLKAPCPPSLPQVPTQSEGQGSSTLQLFRNRLQNRYPYWPTESLFELQIPLFESVFPN